MSRRDLLFFLAGVLVSGATLGVYLLPGTSTAVAAEILQPQQSPAASQFNDSDLLAAQRIAPTEAGVASAAQASGSAGSLDEVTSKLAARLNASGGTQNDWRLLAQSYDYMGRTQEAQDARKHLASPDR
ncbi:MAG TPA: hypothetical protein VHZ99_09075 [Steroidobacteraceae bacterium]|jgi:predicted Zn-dependent protease|nr:hypothetical protein [Steroidobacteraceae bacterium]